PGIDGVNRVAWRADKRQIIGQLPLLQKPEGLLLLALEMVDGQLGAGLGSRELVLGHFSTGVMDGGDGPAGFLEVRLGAFLALGIIADGAAFRLVSFLSRPATVPIEKGQDLGTGLVEFTFGCSEP